MRLITVMYKLGILERSDYNRVIDRASRIEYFCAEITKWR